MSGPEAGRISWGRALGGGAFLACSWTWVIGMFLPVYLVRDFGWAGWVAFAIPNVIGAALVGWVWRRAGSSEGFVARNEGVMRVFSAWTVLFHVAFLGWFLAAVSDAHLDDWAAGGVGNGLLLIGAMLLGGFGSRGLTRLSVVVMLLSAGAVIGAALTGPTIAAPPSEGVLPGRALALAFPVIALGFLLCPHLDFTLHRVRQELTGATGTAAFALGFGVFFLALIGMSLFYAGSMSRGSVSLYIVGHIAGQSLFTMSAHLRELYERGVVFSARRAGVGAAVARRRTAVTAGVSTLCLVFAIVTAVAIAERWIPVRIQPGFSSREMVYKILLGAYALAFPAWAWIVSVRWGAGVRARVAVWVAAVAVAGPCVWLGLLQGPILGEPTRWYWLLPVATGVVAASALLVRRGVRGVSGAG